MASPDEQFDNSFEPCPDKPCNLCIGNSAVVKSRDPETREPTFLTSWEWCQQNNACAATIDWELIFQGR